MRAGAASTAVVPPRALRCTHHPEVVMLRRDFSSAIPVEIDECPECGGLWLDTDELARIRRS